MYPGQYLIIGGLSEKKQEDKNSFFFLDMDRKQILKLPNPLIKKSSNSTKTWQKLMSDTFETQFVIKDETQN